MTERLDEKKFREAYSNYYPLVYSVLYSKLSRKQDAEDICQEVFIRFLNKFSEVENHRQWLMTAIRFEITNYYNKKATARQDEADIDEIENDLNFAFQNGMKDIRIIIEEAINNDDNYKDEKERLIIDLVAVHNFSYRKAAQQLGITRWQAEYIYNKVEKKILAFLKRKGIKEIGDLL